MTARADPIERKPATVSRQLGTAAAVVAVAAAARYSLGGAAAGLLGLAVFLAGVVVGTRRAVSIGAAGLLSGVLYAGVVGAHPVALLVGVGASVFAWDAGGTAIDLGAQLGREADTVKLEAVHAAGSLVVGTAAAAVGYAVFLTAAGGQPVAALFLLLLAGVLLLSTLDRS